jgi:uncharacterized protein YkuJ
MVNLVGALNKETKQLVLAKDADKQTNYICIGCKEDLIFRKGDVNIHHFSHKPHSKCLYFSNSSEESQIHKTAKKLLKKILTNKQKLIISKKCATCSCECDEEVLNNSEKTIELEYNFTYNGERIADVAYLVDDQIKYIFEICHTHKTEENNRPEPWFEFDAMELIHLYNSNYFSDESTFRLNCIRNNVCNNCVNFNNVGCIYFNQRGAGCGKTYESVQLLTQHDTRFKNKNIFIYLTKAHSAKDVIYSELLEQQERGALDNLTEIEANDNLGKQYKMTYINKETNELITVIIGTIDSFNYAIANKNKIINTNDFFTSLIYTICDGFINVSSKNKHVRYARKNPLLNENCLIIIDESQDLIEEQIKAFDKIIEITKIDVYVIGDLLQSIWKEKNVYTCINNSTLSSNIIKNTGINKCLRFHNTQFINFVNQIIPFQEYNLPEITEICDGNCKYSHENDELPYNLFETPKIYSNSSYARDIDYYKMNKIIEYIKQKMDEEIQKYNYLPKNFMFIFPILSVNAFAQIIEIEIQKYWIEKFNDSHYQQNVLEKDNYWKYKINDNKFYKYIILHKSDEGKSINLNESNETTRIVSIHTSKGTGREVVFVLGINEQTLKLFSKQSKLVYDSLLHVAITRQKKKIYFGVEINNDNIHNKFKQFEIIKIQNLNDDLENNLNSISKQNYYTKVINYSYANNETWQILNDNIIIPNHYDELFNETDKCENKPTIEMSHHLIRYLILEFNLLANMVKTSSNRRDKNQIITILKKISRKKINPCNKSEYINILRKLSYKEYLRDENGKKTNRYQYDDIIPVLKFDNEKENVYCKYSNKLILMIDRIQTKIKNSIVNYEMPTLCSLESVIMMFIAHITEDGIYSMVDIMQVYSIIDAYNFCRESYLPSHCRKYNCRCNHVIYKIEDDSMSVDDNLKKIITDHYLNIENINSLYDEYQSYILDKYNMTNVIYNVWHRIQFSIGDFNFSYKLSSIGYSNDSIIYFIITPQYNKLNHESILIKEILINYAINSEFKTNNHKRYADKKIYTCIFTLDLEKPIFHELNINKNDENILLILKKYLFHHYSEEYNEKIYKFYKYCKNDTEKPTNINSVEYTIEKINDLINQQKAITGGYSKMPQYILKFFEEINYQIKSCNGNKNDIINNVMPKISTFEEFDINMKLFLHDEIYGPEISDEIIDY